MTLDLVKRTGYFRVGRLIAIASDVLGYAVVNRKADFFTFRHTGATRCTDKWRPIARSAVARGLT